MPLKLVGVTKKAGYEGLILKYKIDFERIAAGNSGLLTKIREETPSERVYKIAVLNLYSDSGLEQVHVGNMYTYSGFMAGYGSYVSNESSLTCEQTQTEVLKLDVYSTYYRPPYLNNAEEQEPHDGAHLG